MHSTDEASENPAPDTQQQMPAPRPQGATLANLLRWLLIVALLVAAGVSWWSQPVVDAEAHAHSHGGDATEQYTCPMHPTYVQYRPGSCPICGMDLVPEASLKAAQPKDPSTFVLADLPGVAPVVIATERLQRAGVQTQKVTRRDVTETETWLAVVRRDPARVSVVEARTAGWIEWAKPIQQGDRVKKGDVLARLYSRDVEVAEAELRAARAAAQSVPDAQMAAAMQEEARRRVRSLGGSGGGGKRGGVALRAPRSGVVVGWQARNGGYVAPGQALGSVAEAEALQVEAELPPTGTRDSAVQWHAHWQGTRHALHVVGTGGASASGRGVVVRFGFTADALPNWPEGAQVALEQSRQHSGVLTVARAAVVQADGRAWVYRRAASGRMWPTPVVLGLRDDAFVEVVQGLHEGEEVVVQGAFLVDAQARLAPLPADPSALTDAAAASPKAVVETVPVQPAPPLSAAAVDALLAATEAMASDDADKTTATLQELATELGQPLPFAPELAAARAGWQAFQQSLWPSLRATPQAQGLHVAFCPMAPGGWLQRQPALRNPYYGAKMLRCGELSGTVASVAKFPTAEESP